MKKSYLTIIMLTLAALLAGCSGDGGGRTDNGEVPVKQPILLGSTLTRVELSDFPNDRIIAVLASIDENGQPAGWNTYPDIDNATAVSNSLSGNNFIFSWTDPKYWPLDDSFLYFMAYSPPVNGTTLLSESWYRTLLRINLGADMPDILYASNNADPAAYNKSMNVPVDLGEFRHALSQLTVTVVGDDQVNPDLRVSRMEVFTEHGSALLDLSRGDNGLSVDTLSAQMRYTLVSSATDFITNELKYTVMLFPGTENITGVSITVVDSQRPGSQLTADLMMSKFKNTAQGSENDPVQLERGKNTELTITVRSVPVTGDEIVLEGVLSDWVPGGDYIITIN